MIVSIHQAPHFKELDEQIASVIAGFGGKTFVKLNWSSPKVSTRNQFYKI